MIHIITTVSVASKHKKSLYTVLLNSEWQRSYSQPLKNNIKFQLVPEVVHICVFSQCFHILFLKCQLIASFHSNSWCLCSKALQGFEVLQYWFGYIDHDRDNKYCRTVLWNMGKNDSIGIAEQLVGGIVIFCGLQYWKPLDYCLELMIGNETTCPLPWWTHHNSTWWHHLCFTLAMIPTEKTNTTASCPEDNIKPQTIFTRHSHWDSSWKYWIPSVLLLGCIQLCKKSIGKSDSSKLDF